MSAHPFFAMFAMSFAGYDRILEKRWVKGFFVFVPVTNILWVTTNNLHGLVWQEFIQKANNVVVFVHGPAYGWIYVSSNLLTLIIIVSLALASFSGSAFSRKQGRILLSSILFAEGTNIAYNLSVGMEGVDWTSVAFSVTGALFLWALYGQKFLDIVPIAREKLIDSLSDGMIVLDTHGRIVDINQPAAQMLNSLPGKLMGKNLEEFQALARSISGQLPEQEIRTETEIGVVEKRYFDVLITPLFEKRTQVVGQLIIFHDMTSRKQNELRLIQFSRAVEQSPVSVVITDLDGNITYVNPQFSSLTGYTFEEALGKNPRILQSGHTSPETYREMWHAITSGKIWKGEFLNKKKKGDLYWEHATIAPVLDHDGRVINYIAVKADITERKRAEEELQASEARYRALFDQTHDAVFILDFEGHHLMVNQRAADMLGYTLDELLKLSVKDTSAEIDQSQNVVARLLAGEHIPLYERLFRKKNGEIFPVEINVELVEDEKGKPLHIQSTVRDITERKRMEDELQRLARTDPLTELMNRRHFFELAEKEFIRSRRYHRPLAVILLDLDLFKKINDTYGHLAGDQALIHIGDLLRNNTRETDVVARYGGEEFILLLPETDSTGAQALAEHLRRKVEATSLDYENTTITVTISIGIAGKDALADVASLDQVISQADKALYEAKRTGRNRVVCSH